MTQHSSAALLASAYTQSSKPDLVRPTCQAMAHLALADGHGEIVAKDLLCDRERLAIQDLILQEDYRVWIPDRRLEKAPRVLCIIWRQHLPCTTHPRTLIQWFMPTPGQIATHLPPIKMVNIPEIYRCKGLTPSGLVEPENK